MAWNTKGFTVWDRVTREIDPETGIDFEKVRERKLQVKRRLDIDPDATDVSTMERLNKELDELCQHGGKEGLEDVKGFILTDDKVVVVKTDDTKEMLSISEFKNEYGTRIEKALDEEFAPDGLDDYYKKGEAKSQEKAKEAMGGSKFKEMQEALQKDKAFQAKAQVVAKKEGPKQPQQEVSPPIQPTSTTIPPKVGTSKPEVVPSTSNIPAPPLPLSDITPDEQALAKLKTGQKFTFEREGTTYSGNIVKGMDGKSFAVTFAPPHNTMEAAPKALEAMKGGMTTEAFGQAINSVVMAGNSDALSGAKTTGPLPQPVVEEALVKTLTGMDKPTETAKSVVQAFQERVESYNRGAQEEGKEQLALNNKALFDNFVDQLQTGGSLNKDKPFDGNYSAPDKGKMMRAFSEALSITEQEKGTGQEVGTPSPKIPTTTVEKEVVSTQEKDTVLPPAPIFFKDHSISGAKEDFVANVNKQYEGAVSLTNDKKAIIFQEGVPEETKQRIQQMAQERSAFLGEVQSKAKEHGGSMSISDGRVNISFLPESGFSINNCQGALTLLEDSKKNKFFTDLSSLPIERKGVEGKQEDKISFNSSIGYTNITGQEVGTPTLGPTAKPVTMQQDVTPTPPPVKINVQEGGSVLKSQFKNTPSQQVATVNPINQQFLDSPGGLNAGFFKAGGQSYIDAQKKMFGGKTLNPGDVGVTDSGELSKQGIGKVLNVVYPDAREGKYGPDPKTNKQYQTDLTNAYKNMFEQAAQNGITKIQMPMGGTGIFNGVHKEGDTPIIPESDMAKLHANAMKSAMKEFQEKHPDKTLDVNLTAGKSYAKLMQQELGQQEPSKTPSKKQDVGVSVAPTELESTQTQKRRNSVELSETTPISKEEKFPKQIGDATVTRDPKVANRFNIDFGGKSGTPEENMEKLFKDMGIDPVPEPTVGKNGELVYKLDAEQSKIFNKAMGIGQEQTKGQTRESETPQPTKTPKQEIETQERETQKKATTWEEAIGAKETLSTQVGNLREELVNARGDLVKAKETEKLVKQDAEAAIKKLEEKEKQQSKDLKPLHKAEEKSLKEKQEKTNKFNTLDSKRVDLEGKEKKCQQKIQELKELQEQGKGGIFDGIKQRGLEKKLKKIEKEKETVLGTKDKDGKYSELEEARNAKDAAEKSHKTNVDATQQQLDKIRLTKEGITAQHLRIEGAENGTKDLQDKIDSLKKQYEEAKAKLEEAKKQEEKLSKTEKKETQKDEREELKQEHKDVRKGKGVPFSGTGSRGSMGGNLSSESFSVSQGLRKHAASGMEETKDAKKTVGSPTAPPKGKDQLEL